jgi:CHASE3 domain sensor protein
LLAFVATLAANAQTADPATTQTATSDQDHIVSPQALDQRLADSSAVRQKNIDTLQKLIATPEAQKAMHDAKVDPQQVKHAIPNLSDEELANLSARATHAQQDFAAGHIGPSLFTILIIAIIVVIILIVIH